MLNQLAKYIKQVDKAWFIAHKITVVFKILNVK